MRLTVLPHTPLVSIGSVNLTLAFYNNMRELSLND